MKKIQLASGIAISVILVENASFQDCVDALKRGYQSAMHYDFGLALENSTNNLLLTGKVNNSENFDEAVKLLNKVKAEWQTIFELRSPKSMASKNSELSALEKKIRRGIFFPN